jgi:hypothetical protein
MMEQDAAPEGEARNLALGRPWVAVRPHYEGLPLMAGRGADEGWRMPPGSGRGQTLPSAPGSYGPGDRKAAMARQEAPRTGDGA